MKKEIIYVIFMLVFLPLTLAVNSKITGYASSEQTNVSIVVLPSSNASLTITKPENKTYNTNISILINYSSSNAESIWYNLDSQANITIASFTYFNTSEGHHTLYLYANNSQGTETSANTTFFINNSYGWLINSTRYSGNSTNLTLLETLGKSYMQNISNFTLEIANYGKIRFNAFLNLSRELNLDGYSNISSNSIYINSNQLPELNASATLWFYDLTYSNPRILIDGEVCPSTICTKQSYSSNTLIFNVTHFSTYSSEETPVQSSPGTGNAGGGGGGGGMTISTTKDWTVNKDKIKVSLKLGETKKEEIKVHNTGSQKISINIYSQKLENFIEIRERSFELNPGESKTIILYIVAREDAIPDLYMGNLIIKGEGTEKEVLIAVEVKSKKPLFDVNVEIPKKLLKILPGEELLAKIKLFNIGGERVDANLEYEIKSRENELILQEKETVAVETQASFIKEFLIPEDVNYGTYILYVRVTYNNEIASASSWFDIGITIFTIERIILAVSVLIIIALVIMIYEIRKVGKHLARYSKIDENILVEKGLIKLKGGAKKWYTQK